MKASIIAEDDVLAMYALQDRNNSQRFYFYEVYNDEKHIISTVIRLILKRISMKQKER